MTLIESMNRMPWKQRAIVGQLLIVCWVLNCLCWLSGCGPEQQETVTKRYSSGGYYGLRVVEVDGCEYVLYTHTDAATMVHKANCKNPIHKAAP